jgi:hypothetical protein
MKKLVRIKDESGVQKQQSVQLSHQSDKVEYSADILEAVEAMKRSAACKIGMRVVRLPSCHYIRSA